MDRFWILRKRNDASVLVTVSFVDYIKKALPSNAILKWYFAESHICVILMPLSRSVKTCFWGLIGFSEWKDLWLIAVKRESWLKEQDF